MAEELYIAHSLARNFFWSDCILWPADLEGQGEGGAGGAPIPTLVALSGAAPTAPTAQPHSLPATR